MKMDRGLTFLGGVALLAGLLLAWSGAAPGIIALVMVLVGAGLAVAAFRKPGHRDR